MAIQRTTALRTLPILFRVHSGLFAYGTFSVVLPGSAFSVCSLRRIAKQLPALQHVSLKRGHVTVRCRILKRHSRALHYLAMARCHLALRVSVRNRTDFTYKLQQGVMQW